MMRSQRAAAVESDGPVRDNAGTTSSGNARSGRGKCVLGCFAPSPRRTSLPPGTPTQDATKLPYFCLPFRSLLKRETDERGPRAMQRGMTERDLLPVREPKEGAARASSRQVTALPPDNTAAASTRDVDGRGGEGVEPIGTRRPTTSELRRRPNSGRPVSPSM